MKIKNITIKNFKFHHNLEFDIEKNCLIYGENGTGKSSVYKALYSNFYFLKDKKIVTNQIDVKEKFLNRDFSTEDLEVNIDFNTELLLSRKNNTLENSEILENQTIYFADEKVLHKIVQNDFYEVINSELVKHFLELNRLNKLYNRVKTLMSRKNEQEELIKERKEVDDKYKKLFNELIPIDEVNKIINKEFREDFEIEFDIKDSDIQFDNQKFISPKISIKVKNIDDKGDFKNHFNEAKLKLIAIAIYFALAKKYETDSDLKLLVLDDFLTSLDMANRKLIIQYILENFKDYQKIIMTHNIQFSNLIIELLKMRDESREWDIKNLFFRRVDSSYETVIYDKETDYIKQAEEYLNQNYLDEAGIYLRKEFERILDELRQKNEIGAKEKLGNIVNQLLELDDSTDINIKKMQEILKKTKFYQDTVLHSTAHYDSGIPIYRKELNGAKVLLEQLRRQLKVLKV